MLSEMTKLPPLLDYTITQTLNCSNLLQKNRTVTEEKTLPFSGRGRRIPCMENPS